MTMLPTLSMPDIPHWDVHQELVATLSHRDYKSPPLVSHGQHSDGRSDVSMTAQKYIVRRLTPTECARLQGFPDWWTDGVEGSDSAKYKMWGNGMCLLNLLYIFQGIKDVLPEYEHPNL